ncbi:MAG TPA: type II toxin-antitoxin system HipA family toxin [Candidatus Limnocylindria bacterium]|nr:type II toxin-antitoxin system HipA family toxin [Candidatus Limnocylindria bacterium]
MSRAPRDEVLVRIDDARGPRDVGSLRRTGVGQRADLAFEYAAAWLEDRAAFTIEPALNLIPGEQRRAGGGLFGIFTDAAPDAWGRKILQRREVVLARDEGRRPRTLDGWDLLMGVSDGTRMGALRMVRPSDGAYLDDRPLAIPPQATLRELESIATRLDTDAPASDADVRTWLQRLVAPGASLGGARPKVSFEHATGAMWLAKFPAASDARDMGAWEFVQTRLAERSGITVPPIALLDLGGRYRTFAARRFDRDGGRRRHYASAMTLLDERDHAPDVGYLDIADAIERYGSPIGRAIDVDLAELFRRAVFNALAGNRDDHLRNHGFLHDGRGWRLAPAFDLNPIPDKLEHELSFDGAMDLPDLDAIRTTAGLYRLADRRAAQVIDEVRRAVATWRDLAREVGLPRNEIALMEAAYAS